MSHEITKGITSENLTNILSVMTSAMILSLQIPHVRLEKMRTSRGG